MSAAKTGDQTGDKIGAAQARIADTKTARKAAARAQDNLALIASSPTRSPCLWRQCYHRRTAPASVRQYAFVGTDVEGRQGKGNAMAGKKITRDDLRAAAEKYKNWGKWGPDDEIGTLNYTSAEDIIAAAKLVKKGKVISLALNFDQFGPQGGKTNYPPMGRINPLHLMLRTGTDAYSGVLDKRGIRASDDVVVMPLQSGTQWDGLGHIFYENYMWNGYDCREVTTAGAQKCGIEKTKNKMVGRGVFLDVPRALGKEELEDGYAITSEDLQKTAAAQGVKIKRGDYVIVRTGQMERCQRVGSWD